jgi:hypothetical protein
MTGWKKGALAALTAILLTTVPGIGTADAGESPGSISQPPPITKKEAQLAQVKGLFLGDLEKGGPGRFQAVRLDGSSVFVLDTRDGHLWVWAFGKAGGFITYQGRVFPGLEMGEVVEASESAGKR